MPRPGKPFDAYVDQQNCAPRVAQGGFMITILKDRAEQLPQITLGSGAHSNFSAGACAMELASWIAGEPWSDHPECVCPVIAAFMRSWNDALPDSERTALLLPLIPKTIGTRGSEVLANRRATMAADWLIRVHTPAWLRLAGLTQQADALASLPEIADFTETPGLMTALEAVRKDSAAAGAAARAAARDAAGAAAWAAARDAAGAAAWAAAWAAAGAAARGAAGAAAAQKLAATKAELQASAAQLVERMCALADETTEEAA